MEYMESKMQDQYHGFEAQVEALNPFINDLLAIVEKHNLHNDDLFFVCKLFERGYMPPLDPTVKPKGKGND